MADHVFDERHVGAPGVVHGGAVATVLDDLFGFLPYLVGTPAVTRQLTVDYLSPVLVGVTYRIEATVTSREDRKVFVVATVSDLDERTVATSSAVFITVDVEHFARHGGVSGGGPTPPVTDDHRDTGRESAVGQQRG
ncbi:MULTISPECIES: PaaI family thioesterase [Cellulomonadaceae]|nr:MULTISPECIES: PaaI family thioesterase [Cellulomonadaceae]QZN84868.1 PaaI family thioesterase [Cellulomonas sp. C5510]